MKIAVILNKFPLLSETFILNQITGLLDIGHNVKIFAKCNPREEKTHPDVRKYNLMKYVHYFLPQNKTKTIFYLLSQKFDIIHCYYGPNGILGITLRKMGAKGKIVTSFHGYDISEFVSIYGNSVYKDLFINGDLFLPNSRYGRRKLIKLGCDEKRIKVHCMGIDLKRFKYYKRKFKSREAVKILTIARLVEKKGHEYAIRAVAKLIAKYENILYMIAGDGPFRDKLDSLVSDLGVSDHVKFLGAIEQNEVLNIYRQAHIFILPSITSRDGDQEGAPNVLKEAQSTGLPIISTHHGAIPEVVSDGRSGFLVSERDVNALVERLDYLIRHPELWPKMGRYGREIVEQRFDIHKLNRKLLKIYEAK